jgi:hypothetical protein
MTACRKRPDDYFRFNPPQGLGELDFADYMSEGTIVEITNVWLRSPDGKDSTLAAYEKVKVRSIAICKLIRLLIPRSLHTRHERTDSTYGECL